MRKRRIKIKDYNSRWRLIVFALFMVSFTSFAQSPWAVMTTDDKNTDGSSWAIRETFDHDYLQEYYEEGYYITYVSWTGVWFLNFEKAKKEERMGQLWTRRSELPRDYINEHWDKGFSLTDLAHGKDGWMTVVTKVATNHLQAYAIEKNYPKTRKTTESYKKRGYSITSLQHLPRLGSFAIVYTESPDILDQEIMATKNKKFPKKQIEKFWDSGLTITELTYVEGMSGSGYWVIVASELKDKVKQGWVTSSDGFPEDWVDKQWARDRIITNAQLWNY